MDSIGCFLVDLPVTFSIEKMSVEELLNEAAGQIRDGIAHGRVSYWEEAGSYYGEDLLCLIFQGDIYSYGEYDEIVKEQSELPKERMACNNKMNLQILDSADNFGVMVDYDAGAFERSTVEAFVDLFCQACCALLKVKDYSESVATIQEYISKNF